MNTVTSQDNIQDSFEATLKDENLNNIVVDISELALDSLFDTGSLRDLSIVGTMGNLIRFGANIQDKLFLKKILTFLNKLKSISASDRKKMIDNIDESKKYRVKVGEKLLYIINSCEDYETSELVGVIFGELLKGSISYDEFLKVSTVLKGLSMVDFKWFIKKRERYIFDLDDIGDLVSSGLFELHYEQIDVQIQEKNEREIMLSSNRDKFRTDVDGGVSVHLSKSAEIILEVFSSGYTRQKNKLYN